MLPQIKQFFKEKGIETRIILKQKIKWLKAHEQDVLLGLIVALLCLASFAAGMICYKALQKPPLIFNTP